MREKVVKIKTTVTDASVSPSKSIIKLYFVTQMSSSPLRILRSWLEPPNFSTCDIWSTSRDLYKFLGAYIIIEYFAFWFPVSVMAQNKIYSRNIFVNIWSYNEKGTVRENVIGSLSYFGTFVTCFLTSAFLLHPLSPPHSSCSTPKYNKPSLARFLCCLSLLLKISPSTPSGISNKEIVMSTVKITCVMPHYVW